MKYKIVRKNKKDVRDFEVGYADSKEQAVGLVSYYNENNDDPDVYYIKIAVRDSQYKKRWK